MMESQEHRKPTVRTITRMIYYWYAEYVMTNPTKSVNRNKHMNAFGTNIGELFPNLTEWPRNPAFNPENKRADAKAKIDDVRFLVADYLCRIDWTELTGIAKIDLLTLMTNTLKKFFKDIVEENKANMDADHCAAYLVDYINFVGVRMGVDYRLYTGDITHEQTKKTN